MGAPCGLPAELNAMEVDKVEDIAYFHLVEVDGE